MTKVDVTFKLFRALNEKDLKNIRRIHAVYGILAARLLPSRDEMFVEYDQSRLTPPEVRRVLEEHGLPLA